MNANTSVSSRDDFYYILCIWPHILIIYSSKVDRPKESWRWSNIHVCGSVLIW